MRHAFFVTLFAFLVGFAAPVCAQEVLSDYEQRAAALADAQSEALSGQLYSVMSGLDQAEKTHFNIIYGNYTTYSLVKAVRVDIGEAVSACEENNPSMKKKLDTRWGAWQKSVKPNMKEALDNIKALSTAQDYVSEEQLQRIFALVDATRAANSSRFETMPLTTPEACEYMVSKMDETQDSMNMMLIMTLRSYPDMMKRMQE